LIQQTGQDGQWLIELLSREQTTSSLRELAEVKVLEQVWQQQVELVEGLLTFRTKLNLPASEIIETPHDPKVHYSRKRESSWKGYKVHITETVQSDQPHLITDVTTTSATTTDGEALSIIQDQLNNREVLPAVQLADMGYVNGENLEASRLKAIRLVGPIRADTSLQARLEDGISLEHFELDYTEQVAQCPGGSQSSTWSKSHERNQKVIEIKFAGEQCQGCDLYSPCVMGDKSNPAKPPGRILKLRHYHQEVAARRIEQQQPEFKKIYRGRAGVEASLSEMVRGHGLRFARYIGLAKESLRNLFIGAGTNLKRAARWLAGLRPKPVRKPGLASLSLAQ
jgi:transposase